jgi:hypothetical protein
LPVTEVKTIESPPDTAKIDRLKPPDDRGFDFLQFSPRACLNGYGLKKAIGREEPLALRAIGEVSTGAPSRLAVSRKVARKDGVLGVTAKVIA